MWGSPGVGGVKWERGERPDRSGLRLWAEALEHLDFLVWAVSGHPRALSRDWRFSLGLAVSFESANGIPWVEEELEKQGL